MQTNAVAGSFRPGILATIALVHVAAAYGISRIIETGVSGAVIWWAVVLYIVCSLGITVGYHRLWTHRSFKCTPFLERLLAIQGALALEGDIWTWYKNHQQHHAYTDKPGDPHSPVVDGFWWSHVGWLFQEVVQPSGYRQVTFQDANPVVLWQKRWFWPLAIGFGFIMPLAFTWDVNAIWLAGFIRVVVHWHVTWAVNSVCHRWGKGPRDASGLPLKRRDASTDNWVVALLGAGEGWHATHHADPSSYDLAVRWWRYDLGKWYIDVWAFLHSVTERRGYNPG
jgi:stearoyl-CoA desaturase (delta-9 desaturase)